MARPPVLPSFATSATYPAGASPWSSQPPRVAPSGGMLAQGFTPQTDMPAEYVNYLIGLLGDWVSYLDGTIWSELFGDGSDGALVFDGVATVLGLVPSGNVYTATRDIYATSLTVTGASTVLNMAGFTIYATVSLTTVGGASVANDGVAGLGGGSSTPGAGASAGTIAGGTGGGAGGANSVGTAGTNQSGQCYGGAGGAGGAMGGNAGGAGGTIPATTASSGSPRGFISPGSIVTRTGVNSFAGGAGGGGGGSNAVGGPNVGGGGGGGGGVLTIFARSLSLAGAGDLHAKGGNGANAAVTSGGGAGGGGGGALQVVYIIKNAVTFAAATNCPGGNPGTGTGGGAIGTIGSNGTLFERKLS